jgi:hypothetical protein
MLQEDSKHRGCGNRNKSQQLRDIHLGQLHERFDEWMCSCNDDQTIAIFVLGPFSIFSREHLYIWKATKS